MANDKKAQILAALEKLGPSTPTAVADNAGLESSVAGYHLRALLAEGRLKAAGVKKSRVYALPNQKLEGAAGKAKRKRSAGKKKANGKPARRSARRPAAREKPAEFIPAIDAESALVIFAAGAPPVRYTKAQTEQIAALLFVHYDA